jgi:hypothetical protein
MKKFSFLFFFLTVLTVIVIPISALTYPGGLIPQQSDSYSFSGETDTLYYLPDTTKFLDNYSLAEEVWLIYTRFTPKPDWKYYKVKEVQYLFSLMVLGDTLKLLDFCKDSLRNRLYAERVNVILDSSKIYPNWCSVKVLKGFPTFTGSVEIRSPLNTSSLCLPINSTQSGNTLGYYDKSNSWEVTTDLPIKLIIEQTTDTIPTVEFNCDMSVQMKHGTFAATDSVWVRGNFNDWAGKAFLLTDPDGDSVYSGLYNNFTVGQSLVFKYVHSPDVWESTGNRSLTVGVGPNFTSACWEDVCVYKQTKTIQVTFKVNMDLERLSGLFNPTTSTVSVRGSFNGWGETMMSRTSATSDTFKVVTPIVAAVDEKINFKFFYSPGTWEVNNLTDMTQNDRYFVVSQNNFDSASFSYTANFNNNELEIPPKQDAIITFMCNTNGASIINAPAGTEFKTIHMAGGNSPLQWPGSGWPDQDITKVIQLFDDGTHHDAVAGDKIFTNEIRFPGYSSLNIVYKYSANWGLPANGGANDNEAGSGLNKNLKLGRYTTSAVVKDTFGIVHTTDVSKVEKLGNIIPSAYKLEQNYPNPFNPETVISWQIAVGSHVTLKVYDVLGKEVVTLVNEEQPAGSYQVEFSSKNSEISSGVFFYQLRAGDFVQTKKMILLR